MPKITHSADIDRELFDRELNSFVPDVVCDAHAHLWARADLPAAALAGAFGSAAEPVIDLATYRDYMAGLLPNRRIAGGLLIPGAVGATGASLAAENELVSRAARSAPGWRSSFLITPQMTPEYVRAEARRLGAAGLKCYHVHSGKEPSWDAEIPDYLPEPIVRVADEEGLCITLHMVRRRAVADPSNQRWIRHYCETYPRMRLILAHAARGFNPNHTIEGIPALRGLPNLWCDMAAVTDVGACEAIIEALGHERLLYGTDFPVSHLRGRCVAIGDGFLWLYEDTVDWATVWFLPLQPVLIGLESLRVLKHAAWHRRLSDRQVEDIFCNNARQLLGLDKGELL
ncbi:MAG: Amidohydro-rel protein [Chloroflexota bacterium]|nr:Amidohydro-rel protein [Chloroflexota bacterium]